MRRICRYDFGVISRKDAKTQRRSAAKTHPGDRCLKSRSVGRKTSNQYLATYTLQQAFLVTAAVDAFVKKLISEVNFGTVAKVDAEDL